MGQLKCAMADPLRCQPSYPWPSIGLAHVGFGWPLGSPRGQYYSLRSTMFVFVHPLEGSTLKAWAEPSTSQPLSFDLSSMPSILDLDFYVSPPSSTCLINFNHGRLASLTMRSASFCTMQSICMFVVKLASMGHALPSWCKSMPMLVLVVYPLSLGPIWEKDTRRSKDEIVHKHWTIDTYRAYVVSLENRENVC